MAKLQTGPNGHGTQLYLENQEKMGSFNTSVEQL
jgi:hypothetical protein